LTVSDRCPGGVATSYGDGHHMADPQSSLFASCEVTAVAEETTPTQHSVYERVHASAEFQDLRKRYRGFAIPATIAFMVWYLLFVFMSNWANDFMSTKVIGNINVALVFGLLQFVSTFGIAWLYARHANRELDPIAGKLQREYEEGVHR
jgi:uncharacterized membrane protein (DUF485 family)